MKTNQFTKFIKGQRVQLVGMSGEESHLPVGTKGTVKFFSDLGDWAQVGVDWDNGSRLIVCMPEDKIIAIAL